MTEFENKTYTLNIGVDDFKKMATSNTLFVDKTSFISRLLGSGYHVTLITRPRRWGKTLNMTMLQYFFSIPVKSNGEIDEEERLKKREIFSELKIRELPDILENYLGKFPAIFVSFKEIKGKDYETVEMKVRELIYELYTRYKYLLQSEKLDDIQKTRFKKFITKEFDLAELTNSLFHLSEMLYTHFGQKVFILIDEYDTPLNDWYALQLARDTLSVQEETYFQDVLELFKGIFGKALKGNDYLEKGVVTGILRVAKANLFSGVNNFGEDSILEEDYAEQFGFTESEVNTLLHKARIDQNPETANALKSWYNGYNIGGLTIYNPWSIMNCIQNRGKFKAYWVGTASTALIEQALVLDKFQEEMQTLIEGGSVDMIADPKMVFSDIKSSPNALYNLLLFSGYLTVERSIENDDTTYNCEVKIPNREVRSVFSGSLQKWISKKFNIDVKDYNAFLNDLLKGNVETFTQKLKDYLEVSASFFATGPKNAELFYNGFIMGLVSAVSSQYFVETERESGLGRADLLLIPKPMARYQNALVLEFKFGKSREDLTALAQKALEQIETKNYMAKIKAHETVMRTLKVGLAFGGKDVEVAFK
ncbi:MAG: hypothetical protein B7Y25_03570 [Alphaproteobacteria bacterium 16-39-46]|nr:MAG: hypothetical protein B7Y25_03570 [Alphaproteobacteria bacterium 16-39-46]OZA43239.1 MAG: hypothetical protein B7X84_03795 [Alphaproteobacteria bacterium 17-39-52]HQS83995.1 AAA family ATPase [Alphaproteobacteria bacterium]HQS93864.1 AAA family ATPase [Alphaproteobacteria bacterium]